MVTGWSISQFTSKKWMVFLDDLHCFIVHVGVLEKHMNMSALFSQQEVPI
jgi:hypothetical protein